MYDKITNHPYFKEQTKLLNSYDENKISLRANEDGGIDYSVEFEPSKLEGIDTEADEFEEALKDALEGCDIHFYDEEHNCIIVNTCDESFTNDSKEFYFPDLDSQKYVDDFHLWLLFQESAHDSGTYPGIYHQGYYGECTSHNFDEDYGKLMPTGLDLKPDQWVNYFLEFYKMNEQLDMTTLRLYDFPEGGYPNMLSVLDEETELIEVIEITPTHLTISLEFDEDEVSQEDIKKYNPTDISASLLYDGVEYEGHFIATFKISMMPNSIQLFKELSAS